MRVTLSVGSDSGACGDLRRWLLRDPELRSRTAGPSGAAPPPGTMGAAGELINVLLAPGGLTAALAAAVVAWLQNRRGNQTVTITRPDGTQVTVTSERVRGLTAEGSGDLARQIADALQDPATALQEPGASQQPEPAAGNGPRPEQG
ncbi:effector-associated constant component EACC1 [Streptomyces violens]|uniref:effector-associated constant component EACC1 n=1 Tax=Streptomyces violens TaxID=66377 RepID=UPI000AD8824F|nr:hypothetical protein [Streptomyces violens]